MLHIITVMAEGGREGERCMKTLQSLFWQVQAGASHRKPASTKTLAVAFDIQTAFLWLK